MMQRTIAFAGTAVLATLFGIGIVLGQEHSAGHQAKQPEDKSAMPDMSQAIFCPMKSTGQLCHHGTADLLKLTGAKRQQWTEAANRYNKAVEAATKQLLEEAKTTLSPEELALVEKWFAKGLNPEINRLLATQ